MLPEKLSQGYADFLEGRFNEERARYETLASTGQSPEVMIIGCCDSRVSPEVIFNTRPGELFIARNVANLVPPYQKDGTLHGTSAALEYAVEVLKVKHIIVLGHENCGGIRAFATNKAPQDAGDFIGRWISLIAPAAKNVCDQNKTADLESYIRDLELATINKSLENLLSFDMIKSKVDTGVLQLHGAYFGIAEGRLLVRDVRTGEFIPLTSQSQKRLTAIGCSA